MLPDSLIELIERVIKEAPLTAPMDQAHLDKADLWKDFTWCIFLDANRINAEVTFIRNTLWDAKLLDKDWILNHTQQEWEDSANKFISNHVSSLSGRKSGALSGLLSDLSTPAQSLKESAHFFKNNSISMQTLKNNTIDDKSTDKFLSQMAYRPASSYITGKNNAQKIFNVGLVKAILWLQTYGLTKNYCPPSRQIKNFVDDDMKHLSWSQKKYQKIPNFQEEWQYVFHIRDFNDKEVKPILAAATTNDTGIAIWYWKIMQGLLKGTHYGSQLTPKKLLAYLGSEGMNLDDLVKRIDDIDDVDNLTNDVKAFLQANP